MQQEIRTIPALAREADLSTPTVRSIARSLGIQTQRVGASDAVVGDDVELLRVKLAEYQSARAAMRSAQSA